VISCFHNSAAYKHHQVRHFYVNQLQYGADADFHPISQPKDLTRTANTMKGRVFGWYGINAENDNLPLRGICHFFL